MGGGIIVVDLKCVYLLQSYFSFKMKFYDIWCQCFSAGTRRTSETSQPVPTAPFGLLSAQNNGSWAHRGWSLSKYSQRERQAHTPDRPPACHRTHTHTRFTHTLNPRGSSVRKATREGGEHVESTSIYLFIDLIIKSIYFYASIWFACVFCMWWRSPAGLESSPRVLMELFLE